MKELSKEDWKNLSEHYRKLSDIYMIAYEQAIEPTLNLSAFMGVIVEMQSELEQFKIKNKNHPKIQDSQKRISFLMSLVDKFSILNDRYIQLKYMLRDKECERVVLYNKNLKLTAELEAINKAFNAA